MNGNIRIQQKLIAEIFRRAAKSSRLLREKSFIRRLEKSFVYGLFYLHCFYSGGNKYYMTFYLRALQYDPQGNPIPSSGAYEVSLCSAKGHVRFDIYACPLLYGCINWQIKDKFVSEVPRVKFYRVGGTGEPPINKYITESLKSDSVFKKVITRAKTSKRTNCNNAYSYERFKVFAFLDSRIRPNFIH